MATQAIAGKTATVVNEQTETVQAGKVSQKKIDQLSEAKNQMLEEYRLVLRQTESLKSYNDQMETLVQSQEEEKASIATQIDEIETTSKDVVPLMLEMLETLEEFVELDVPFLEDERSLRVSQLKKEMNRADVSTSEKFRRILEAYQVENEYGRTIEAYQADVSEEGGTKTVDFLRIGRVALIYLTLDGKEAKAWNAKEKKFVPVEDRFLKPIHLGLKIAKKQAAPDLLTLPIQTPEAL